MRSERRWLALALMLLWGCSQNGGSTSTESDTTEVSRRHEIENQVTEHLIATRARLDSLRSEAAVLGEKLDAKMTAQIAAVEMEKDSAQVRLEQLQQAGEEKWEDMRAGFAVMLDSLDVKIDRLRENLHRRG